MPFAALDTLLKIILVAMEGQPPEVRAKLWERHMAFLEKADAWWERMLKIFSGATEPTKRRRKVVRKRVKP